MHCKILTTYSYSVWLLKLRLKWTPSCVVTVFMVKVMCVADGKPLQQGEFACQMLENELTNFKKGMHLVLYSPYKVFKKVLKRCPELAMYGYVTVFSVIIILKSIFFL